MKQLARIHYGWAAGLALTAMAQAEDWPQFLGPLRDGAAGLEEAALPDQYQGEAKVLWRHEVGSGHAGPVVCHGKVVICHRVGDDLVVEALDALTGKQAWQQRFPTDYRDSFGMDEGPRAVPAVADGRVFVHNADGLLYALGFDTGKLIWQVDTRETHDSPQGFFGRACAPLVIGDKVMVTTGGKSALTAFDVKSGKPHWSGGEDEASYASPVKLDDQIVIAWLRDHLATFDVNNGKVLDRNFYRPSIEASVSAATPVRTNHGWFLSAEYDVGCSLWQIASNGALAQVWSSQKLLNAHYATPVHHDGFVYGFDGRQEQGMTLRCIDLENQKVAWESPSVRGGTLLRVKDKLIVLTEEGEIWIVPATPDKFEQLFVTQVLRANHRSYAAFANGIWYARDSETLVAVRLTPP